MIQITKWSAAYGAHIVRIRPMVEVHVAVVEMDVPRAARVVGDGRGRPVTPIFTPEDRVYGGLIFHIY